MEKTNEILAAYAVGNVSETERDAVRQYLVDNPSELETVMMMMDEDYDMDIDDDNDEVADVRQKSIDNSFSDICYSKAAFVPTIMPKKHIVETPGHADKTTFSHRLNILLDEIIG